MEETSVIERLPLEHPLPDEIQTMEKEDTVCKFCGVSYLIHHEVKKLEDKVKEVEEQLEHYKGSVEREKILKEEVKQMKQNEEEMQKQLQQKEASITQLKQDLNDKDDLIQSLTLSRKGLEEKLTAAHDEIDNLRKQKTACKKHLPSIQTSLRQQRSELQNIVTYFHQMQKSVHDTSNVLTNTMQRVCASHSKESLTLKEKLETLEDENKQLHDQQQSLQQAVHSAQGQSKQLEGMQRQLREKQELCNKLRQDMEKLQHEVDSTLAKSKTSASEAAQYKEMLRSKSQEITDIHQQHRMKEQVTEQLNSKLQTELKNKSAELQGALSNYRKLQQQANDNARIEEEIQRKAAMNMTETNQLRDALLKAQEESNAVKDEREIMITSHQNRIEQLRESFKQKLIEAEKWPQKMDDTLQKERSRHVQELQDMEEKLRNAFQMELEIEKQKHQELLDTYKAENQETVSKMRSELRSIRSRHKAELNQRDKQLHEARHQASTGEDALKKEVQSLKGIITSLEDRLGRVGLEDNQAVVSLKAELREAEQDLNNAREETKQMEEKLNQSKEEIIFLQETVRNECEERFELTEALSLAKEQLLSFGGRHGSLTPVGSRPTSATKGTLSREGTLPGGFNSTNGSQLQGGFNSANGSLSPGGFNSTNGNPNSIAKPPPGQKFAASNSINLGFDSNNVQSQGRAKRGSMSDSRNRISAAIGRR